MRTPKVSIGLPVYNGESFLREALDSLLIQSYSDFELVISDNGSTDMTEAICREYCVKDQRIKYLRLKENIGAVKNFQYVLEKSSGEYFMWFACDDKWDQDALEHMVSGLDGDGGLVGIYAKTILFDDERTVELSASISQHPSAIKRLLSFLKLGDDNFIYGLFRRDVIGRIELSQNLVNDAAFPWLCAVVSQGGVRRLPHVRHYKRIHRKQAGAQTHFNCGPFYHRIKVYLAMRRYLSQVGASGSFKIPGQLIYSLYLLKGYFGALLVNAQLIRPGSLMSKGR